MAFYKLADDGLIVAPNFVYAPAYTLSASAHSTYTYPVDGWTWYETQEAAYIGEGLTVAAPAAPPITAITKTAFRSRFTATERVDMEMAQLDDPTAPIAERRVAAALRSANADLAAATTTVDLALPQTQYGVNALEQYGVIGAGRAAVILSLVIDASERP